jgi:hypothetical protein
MTEWQATHPATGDGYGRAIAVDGGSTPQFTDVTTTDGKVTGWHQVFPAGTHLARAEAAARTALPSDARQTASWRGTFSSGGGFCEFVSYQSASLASKLGAAPPSSSGSNIGAKFYEETSHGSGAASIATVNSAQVRAAPYSQGESC